MIYFGAKNNRQMNDLDKNVSASNSEMKSNLKEVLNSLDKNQQQQLRILNRLENLETIVTSEAWEAWEAIKHNKEPEHLDVLLNDEDQEELTIEEKTETIANRIKY
jgi:CTP-dependent riboflavin kinase